VGVNVSPEEVVGYVEDDGRGFAEEDVCAGGGVRSMRERAEQFGGALEVSSRPGAGTSVRVSVSLKGEPDNGA
jgi:signal transduction histidine kinase